MADFCKQCSIEVWGKDTGDLAGLSTADETAQGLYALVICEGCGATQVDHEGRCVVTDCLEKHNGQPPTYDPVMHYGVITRGHISFFTIYEEAVQMGREYNGQVFNMFGLTWEVDISDYPLTDPDDDLREFRNVGG